MMNTFLFLAGVATKKVTQIQRSLIPGNCHPEVVSYFCIILVYFVCAAVKGPMTYISYLMEWGSSLTLNPWRMNICLPLHSPVLPPTISTICCEYQFCFTHMKSWVQISPKECLFQQVLCIFSHSLHGNAG